MLKTLKSPNSQILKTPKFSNFQNTKILQILETLKSPNTQILNTPKSSNFQNIEIPKPSIH